MRESLEVVTKNLLFTIQNKLKKPSKGKNLNPSGETSRISQTRRKISDPTTESKSKNQPPWYNLRAENSDDSYEESDFYMKDKDRFSAIEEQYESSTALGVTTPQGRLAQMMQKSKEGTPPVTIAQISPTAEARLKMGAVN